MKQNTIKILFFSVKFLKFIGFSSAIYFVLVVLWGLLIPEWLPDNLNYYLGGHGHTFSRLQEAKTTKNVDILFIGSSHAYRGFDVRIFQKAGYKTFNLGTSSQTPAQTYVLLKRYLHKLQPDTIIYEVNKLDFAGDGVESALDIMANDQIDQYLLKITIDINNIKIYNSLIYTIFTKTLRLDENFSEPKKKRNDTYIAGGFVEHQMKHYSKKSERIRDEQINPLQTKYFKKNIKLIRKQNIHLIFVQAPMTQKYYRTIKKRKKFDHFIRKNGIYYNFNNRLNLNDSTHFFDAHHLNQKGVQIFNKQLIDKLKN